MSRFARTSAIVLLLFAVCGTAMASDQITVAAAADLSFAMKDLATDFHARTGNTVTVVYGSSGNFFSQIRSGAPFDVFLSADVAYPRQLEQQGLIEPGSLYVYAVGQLVLWAPRTAGFDLQKAGINAVTDDNVQQIAIANPRHAPYGQAAVAALQHAGLYERIRNNLVFGENVAQTAHFLETGNADVGFIAMAIAVAPSLQTKGTFWVVPSDWYPPLRQAAVVVKASSHRDTANAFLAYLKGPDAATILKRYGFSVPAAEPPPAAKP